MEHAAGLDFDLLQCGECGRYTMNIWTPHGLPESQTSTVAVSDGDAEALIELHERKMVGVRLYYAGERDGAARVLTGEFWNEHRRILEDWLARSSFENQRW
jgi:hypothetical protein